MPVSTTGEILHISLQKYDDLYDMRTYSFFTPAVSSDGIPLEYEWDFDDGKIVDGTNTAEYQFSVFGKTYTPTVTVTNPITKEQKSATISITTPKPDFSINCMFSGLEASCTPVVSGIEGGLQDAKYTWSYGDVNGTAQKLETVGNATAYFSFTGSGKKTISVTGTSPQVEGTFTASIEQNISNQITLGAINCREVTALRYECSVDAQLSAEVTGTLSYEWTFNGEKITNNSTNTAEYIFAKYPPINKPSYTVSVVAKLSDSTDTASQNTSITITHPTVSISENSASSATSRSFTANVTPSVSDAVYTWDITGPNNFSKTISKTNDANSGEIAMASEGAYSVSLSVSHSSFAQTITAAPINVEISSSVKNAAIKYSKNSVLNYTFSTDAVGYAASAGQETEVPLTYTWVITRGDGQETITNSDKSFTQQLAKYGANYTVNLSLQAQGSNKVVKAPAQSFTADLPTVTVSKSADTVNLNGSITFTANIAGLANGVQLQNPVYTWILDGTDQTNRPDGNVFENNTYARTFGTAGSHTVRVKVTADNMNGAITSSDVTITAREITVSPEDITDVTVTCTTEDETLNGIKKQCKAEVVLTQDAINNGVKTDMFEIRLTPRGVNNQADSNEVILTTPNETKDVIFDWPWLNVFNVTAATVPTFTAKLGVQIFYENNPLKTLATDKTFTINYPHVYYDIDHTINVSTTDGSIGTGGKVKLTSVTAPFNGTATWTWKIRMTGDSGTTVDKNITFTTGAITDFTEDMKTAKFANFMDGNPHNNQNGFGATITSEKMSKPLKIFGAGRKEYANQNPGRSLAAYVSNKAYMGPKATATYASCERYSNWGNAFVARLEIKANSADDEAMMVSGRGYYCVYTMYAAKNNTMYDLFFYEFMDTQSSLLRWEDVGSKFDDGSIEEMRKPGGGNGFPAAPTDMGYVGYFQKAYLKDYGFRGVKLGLAINGYGCYPIKTFDFTNTSSVCYTPKN